MSKYSAVILGDLGAAGDSDDEQKASGELLFEGLWNCGFGGVRIVGFRVWGFGV